MHTMHIAFEIIIMAIFNNTLSVALANCRNGKLFYIHYILLSLIASLIYDSFHYFNVADTQIFPVHMIIAVMILGVLHNYFDIYKRHDFILLYNRYQTA